MTCPFCNEDDFDTVGLKTHLASGDCEPFDRVQPLPRRFATSHGGRRETRPEERRPYELKRTHRG